MMPAVEDTVDAPFERNILWSIEKFVLQRAQAVVADTRRSKIIARRVFSRSALTAASISIEIRRPLNL